MCNSYIGAARQFDFHLRIACPEGYEPDPQILATNADRCEIVRDPRKAVDGADLVVTDTWISMGQEEEKARREKAFAGYRVDRAMMGRAAPVPCSCIACRHIAARKSPMMSSTPRQRCLGRGRESHARSKALLEFLLC